MDYRKYFSIVRVNASTGSFSVYVYFALQGQEVDLTRNSLQSYKRQMPRNCQPFVVNLVWKIKSPGNKARPVTQV